jgi:hypothetical protein
LLLCIPFQHWLTNFVSPADDLQDDDNDAIDQSMGVNNVLGQANSSRCPAFPRTFP